MKPSLRFKFLVALAIVAISGLAAAQDQDASGDPPSRVARLQFVEGQVSLQPGGVEDWVAANLNRPLTTADRIWTDRDSKAELTMASAALRLGSETSVTLTNLDDNTAQIELDQGTLNLSVRYLNQGEIVEVDTPNFAYTLSRPGNYRFEVFPDDDQSWITVRNGDGDATGQGNAVRVSSGQQFRFSQGQSLAYTNARAEGPDPFDDWCAVRERRETSSASAGYVAAGTVGYEDLDDNGSWQPTPTYGTVWYPRVHEGWAPYREGHWAWVEPWGWTWVDDAPWGFAPFHYGRWALIGDRWGWIPGPVGVRPVYAPALVAWVGGPSFGVSVGVGGGVGWFPLGWHDPYLPAYRVSPRYAREVNISNSRVVNVTVVNNYYNTTNVNVRNTTINNIRYENSGARGAVTGVSSATFASGRSMRGNSVVVPANAVGRVSVMTSAAVVPTKEAVLGGRPSAAVPQRIVAPRQVVSKVAPPPRPVSFEAQRPLLEKNNGVPLTPQVRNTLPRTPAPARGGQPPAGNQMGGRLPGSNPQAPNRPGQNQPAPNRPGGNQPAANQPAPNRPVANQPAANQPAPNRPVANQPAANQPRGESGRPPSNAPGAPQPGAGNPNAGAGNGRSQPNNPQANTPPANANQNAPGRNVPRPPQPGGNAEPNARPNDSRGNQPHAPVTTMEGRAPAPATETQRPPANQGSQSGDRPGTPNRGTPPAVRETAPPPREAAPARPASQPPREAAPVRPASPPPREAAPARPASPPAREAVPARPPTPPREAAPAQQHRNPPPAKENKDKEKEKDKEPRGR
jgi:hypothetical protein